MTPVGVPLVYSVPASFPCAIPEFISFCPGTAVWFVVFLSPLFLAASCSYLADISSLYTPKFSEPPAATCGGTGYGSGAVVNLNACSAPNDAAAVVLMSRKVAPWLVPLLGRVTSLF